ncbi:MAG TPA: DUF1801 domain-containing protein [Myxococcaceae bacterium]|nr:DUF1801 domain-containing protein [Myxococcaceae bacterium]
MARDEPKTRPTRASVPAFLAALPDERRADARRLVAMLRRASGAPPRLWGTSIVGFGAYRQTYAGGREGDWPVIGFSPRRSEHVLYLTPGTRRVAPLLGRLGKHRTGKSCLYVRSLAEVDLAVLEEILRRSVAAMADRRVERAAAPRRAGAVRR